MVPMYLAEITEDVTRGPICSLFPLFFSTGVLVTFVVKIWTDYYLLTYVLSIFPVLYAATFLFMPETPVYLVKRGEDQKAKESLIFLRGDRYDVNSELLEIKKEVAASTSGEKASLLEVFKDRIYFKTMLACIIIFIFQQLSGINAVIFYTVPIFKAAKSNMDPLVSSILVAAVQVVVTILVMFIVDKFGRKIYLLLSGIIMAICLFLLGLYFHLKLLDVSNSFLDILPLLSLMTFIFSFSFGFGPIPWVVVGEINTPEIIGTVSSIAMIANWFSGFVVTKSFAPLLNATGPHFTFYIYAFFNLLGFILTYIFVPETRFKMPHEIFTK